MREYVKTFLSIFLTCFCLANAQTNNQYIAKYNIKKIDLNTLRRYFDSGMISFRGTGEFFLKMSLLETEGKFKGLLKLFNFEEKEYKNFMRFLFIITGLNLNEIKKSSYSVTKLHYRMTSLKWDPHWL